MVISSASPFAEREATSSTTETMKTISDSNGNAIMSLDTSDTNESTTPPLEMSGSMTDNDVDNTADFAGEVNTNNEIPREDVLRKIQDLSVLDREGRAVPFRSLYEGPNVTRRVLVIFIRHFFCGYCQEYLRTLTSSITPDSLLNLPTPTFIAIVGCGSPSLIPMYASETSCPFPIYADPTKKLYDELGMMRTLSLGARPDYQRRSVAVGILQSVRQGLSMLKGGKAFQGGDMQQVGGEFLFEPKEMATPIHSPLDSNDSKQLGMNGNGYLGMGGEEKRITWCHRMRSTRDHVEIPELREVLGLDGEVKGHNEKRWTRALRERKGTGLSARTSESKDGGSSGRQSMNIS